MRACDAAPLCVCAHTGHPVVLRVCVWASVELCADPPHRRSHPRSPPRAPRRYEWVTTAAFNPADPAHQRIKKDIEVGDGLPDITGAQAVRTTRGAQGAARPAV